MTAALIITATAALLLGASGEPAWIVIVTAGAAFLLAVREERKER